MGGHNQNAVDLDIVRCPIPRGERDLFLGERGGSAVDRDGVERSTAAHHASRHHPLPGFTMKSAVALIVSGPSVMSPRSRANTPTAAVFPQPSYRRQSTVWAPWVDQFDESLTVNMPVPSGMPCLARTEKLRWRD